MGYTGVFKMARTVFWKKNHIAAALLPLMLVLLPLAARAQVSPPANPVIGTVPGYNQTIGIWASDTAVGGYVALFLQNAGTWVGCQDCYIAPVQPDINFDTTVANAGGASAYVKNVIVPAANALLARKFPATGGSVMPPPVGSGASTQINYLLGTTCALTSVNGVETLSCH